MKGSLGKVDKSTKLFQLFSELDSSMSNQVALLGSEGGSGENEVFPLVEVLTSSNLSFIYDLDRKKTCQWFRNLLHREGVAVSVIFAYILIFVCSYILFIVCSYILLICLF